MELIRFACAEDAAGIAYVHVESWRSTYRGIVPDDYLANLSYEKREEGWTRILSSPAENVFTLVAHDETGKILGFIGGGPIREGDPVYQTELYTIYLLKECQGRGLGRRLTLALVEKLVEAGFQSMLVWVFSDNPARHFYEALGGQFLKTNEFEIGGIVCEERAYGWLDIGTMLRC